MIYIYIYEKHNSINLLDPKTKRVIPNIYNSIKNQYNSLTNKNSYEASIILLILIIYGFNSQIRFNSKGEFNIPPGKQILNETRKQHLVDFSISLNNKNIEIFSLDFKDFINIHINESDKNDFWYFDPPYSISNATYNIGWTKEDDKKLFEFLDLLTFNNIRWGLSNLTKSKGKENVELINWAKKYKVFYLNKTYINSNYQRKNREEKDEEVYITNYEKTRF